MAKVYVSSTVADLEEERRAVIDWLVEAQHQPVHSYRPNSETVRESCLEDIDGCDLYLLILGHRYGFQPETENPEKLSITQLEFRRAGEKQIPRVALLRTSIPDIRLTDLLDPTRAPLVQAFDREVRKAVRGAEFHDLHGLIQGLSTGVQSELDKLNRKRAPDDSSVLSIVTTLTGELDKKNREIEELRGKVRQLEQAAIARTMAAAEQPGASVAALAAAVALEAGDTRPAEAQLSHQEDKQAARIGRPDTDDAQARKEAAALAREQGALAMGRDIQTALAAFERSAEYEPDDIPTFFVLGDLLKSFGDLNRAMESFRRAQALSEDRFRRDPANTEWQRNLFLSHINAANILAAQGDQAGALAAHRQALEMAEKLVAREPANAGWRRDLSVSYNKIGDSLWVQGDVAEALDKYRQALEISEELTARDPSNPEWRRDVFLGRINIGDVLLGQHDPPGALAAYREALTIAEGLAERDEANTIWQSDLSIANMKIGDVLIAQGDATGALQAYRKSLGIVGKLAARDPANTEWQRLLSVSHENTGKALLEQKDETGAAAEYRKAFEIREKLAARDPANAQWQMDLAFSCSGLGSLAAGQSDDERREFLRRGRAILERLREAGHLLPHQDWREWFDQELAKIPFTIA